MAKKLAVLCLVTATAAVASLASAPRAGALLGLVCPDQTIEYPFAAWGDDNAYVLVSPAESSDGWSLRGASIGSGNEPWYVHSKKDRRAAAVPAGATAETPSLCLTLFDPTMRLFANGSRGGKLQVDAIGHTPLGLSLVLGSMTVNGTGSWSPSDVQRFLANLTSPVTWTISFRLTAVSGSWQVDDVYVDPMLQR